MKKLIKFLLIIGFITHLSFVILKHTNSTPVKSFSTPIMSVNNNPDSWNQTGDDYYYGRNGVS